MGRLSDLNFYTPFEEQQLYGSFSVSDIAVSGANLSFSEGTGNISFGPASRNFNVELRDLKLPSLSGSMEEVKIDGSYGQRYALQGLNITIPSGTFANGLPNFSGVSARIVKTKEQNYDARINGSLSELEVSNSDNFIGVLPESNFIIDLEVDETFTKVVAQPEITFSSLEVKNFLASAKIGFEFVRLPNMECLVAGCELSNFDATYHLKFAKEWLRGNAICLKQFCSFDDLSHSLKTSHTVNLLTGLGQAGILSPISSMYLFGAISSGKKINSGHELKF